MSNFVRIDTFRIFFLGILYLLMTACHQQQHPQPPLLEVGPRQLSLEQFNREVEFTYPNLADLSPEKQTEIRLLLIRQLIDRELILAEATQLNIHISPDEFDQALREIRGNYSADEFEHLLNRTGKSFSIWAEALKQRLLTEKISEVMLQSQPEISSEEIREYYLAHKNEFNRPAERQGRQMLFPTRDEAIKVLQLIKSGQDFATLARTYSHSPDSENGGYLDYFSRGDLPEVFDRVLFELPLNQVSDPVASPYGYHLFIVEQRRRAGPLPLEAVQWDIKEKLARDKREPAFHDWLEKLRRQTQVTIRWELLSNVETVTY